MTILKLESIQTLVREMIKEELEEAGAVGSEQMLQTQHGVLAQIIQKHGGDYAKASQSPEWKEAIAGGDKNLAASVQATPAAPANPMAAMQPTGQLPGPMQVTGAVQKRSLSDMRPSNMAQPNMAQQQQIQQQKSAAVAGKLRSQIGKTQPPAMESTSRVGVSSLTEMIRATVREAIDAFIKEDQQVQAPQAPAPDMGPGPTTEASRPVSGNAAKELALFAVNDYEIYSKGIKPALKNLRLKFSKGVYDPNLSIKLWFYVVTAAAQKYSKQHGSNVAWNEMFSKSTRMEAAKQLASHYDSEIKGA